ncbi:GvpL/GvpF family gas vesicle protein [Streptomyces gibsoniae]|uniref:GvpL/GvpF family gas vesicle protein n=1 Tax=Streptomyces gibsoniae TaxID=3075529 RepID=A0ABU2TQ52_9ACTN|nr:GvpL/GvpF family gas vesicle protein [Streptomyces sp. DSM 41699]MDT0463044.1 GvpL/GvpF family gas vesicle protein [Streptomyces sp. DSM 41699]
MTGLRYVYAVCRPFDASAEDAPAGVAGVPPRQLPHGGLIAIVSTVPEDDFAEAPLRAHLEDLGWLTATARAHQGVIDALTSVTTPLPLRLATVFRDDSGVRAMLEEREDDFHRALDRLDGRVEWGVKVYAETERRERPEGPQETSEPRKTASGRDYLRRRRVQHQAQDEMRENTERFARRLHDILSGCAEESLLHSPQNPALSGASGRNVLNAAYLVPRSASEAFVESVQREESGIPGVRVELTGPWAAYSFSGVDGRSRS